MSSITGEAMRIRILFFVVLISLVGLLVGCANTQTKTTSTPVEAGPVIQQITERGELIVGTTGDMPPLSMRTKDGGVIGYEPDLALYIAAAMGVKLEIKTMEFSELLPALEAGEVDMVVSGMTITPKRNLQAAFVGPYLKSGKCFLTKLERLAKAADADELDVSDMRLAALRGSTSEQFVKAILDEAQLVPVANYDEGVSMVLDDSVGALVADYPICATSILRHPDAGFASLFTLLTYEPLGIAVPPNDPLLVNWLENLLNGLRGSGRLEELKERWLENASWVSQLPESN